MRVDRGVALLLGAALASPAAAAPETAVENALGACVAVQPGPRSVAQGVLLQQVRLEVSRPIGECGCKSALMAYTASAVLEGDARAMLQAGVVNALRSGERMLPLATDPALAGGRWVAISLGCAAPD